MRRKRRGTLEALLKSLPKRDLKLLFKAADAFLGRVEQRGITAEITQKSGAATTGPAKTRIQGGCHESSP
jgi:hypothetical protein